MSIVEKAADLLRQPDRNTLQNTGAKANIPIRGELARNTHRIRPEANGQAGQQAPVGQSITLDMRELCRVGLAPPEAMAQQLAREYQRIKRPLLANIHGDQQTSGPAFGNRLMMTSATAGEGKSFTSFNLACSLARERDYSVLLVDGDVIKPTVTRALGLRDRLGLTDVLAEETIMPEQVIVETDIPGLSILPAGQRREFTTEMLSSRRMAWLMEELGADPMRIVVCDSSPLLATSESQALALNMGQIIVVVKAATTERRAVDAALSLLAGHGRSISMVLNQSRKAHGDAYAGYYGMYYGTEDGAG